MELFKKKNFGNSGDNATGIIMYITEEQGETREKGEKGEKDK